MIKVLVTGAAGSLGNAFVCEAAQRSNLSVFATDIKPEPDGFENTVYQQLDITNQRFLDWIDEVKPDVIVHLASVLQISATLTRASAYEIDVVATEKLIRKAIELKCKKLIVTTSGAAYGYAPRNLTSDINEDWSLQGNEDYFYSAHKRQVETTLEKTRASHPELKQVVFRPGAILGPDFQGPVVDLFKQRFITGLAGYPGLFNFIWSQDVVDYLIEAATTNITGEFNIAGQGTLSLKQIAKMAQKPYLPLPSLLIKLALGLLKPLGLTQYGPEQVKFIKYRPVLCSDKIRQQFKHQPRFNTEQALANYLNSLESDK